MLHVEGRQDLSQADSGLADQGVEEAECEAEAKGREVLVGAPAVGLGRPRKV
jgi:hypothetical protein